MISVADFKLWVLLKSTFFINNRGFTERYIIVMLRDGASLRRLTRMLTYKPSSLVLHIFKLTGYYSQA